MMEMIVIVLLFSLIQLSSSSFSKGITFNTEIRKNSNNSRNNLKMIQSSNHKLVTISEKVWRNAASHHRKRIYDLLKPGFTSRNDQVNTGNRRRRNDTTTTTNNNNSIVNDEWKSLDPIHPIYNFLIEYYGLKGAKGPRRLGRWSPNPSLLLQPCSNEEIIQLEDPIYNAAMEASQGLGGILLQNANQDDIGSTLHLKGCIPVTSNPNTTDNDDCEFYGILYNPALFYNRQQQQQSREEREKLLKTIAPFQWYSSILRTTLSSEPILHCHGLHEWAMQYHPLGAPPPPSAKYQSSLPLRVSRETINETVERKGISCTHVDALRFFAPAAGPLNHHGAQLHRTDQLTLEQKACVHAHMDLFKIAMKIQPFIDSQLLSDVLEVAIKARTLDVEASPYDATAYGAGIVPVETKEGRKLYRDRQKALMEEVEPVRVRLLTAYEDFMELAFEEELRSNNNNNNKNNDDNHDDSQSSSVYIAPERLAKAEPGGLPWRRNLLD